ncbi:trifunctional transcriptional activator/DNA repair protein Ada/methylated-DNA--[protein]-cysteine S-methyltransferase [Sinorhizobium sp. BG8]|uniref:bifunctional transcriptional activator/DNA repair enzyme AdaA n=1 Tax=Sinorhizobium sp. BG8 TaxID=2613773 RepID=UPI00193DD12B|nr:trifunctional transcriptional activator/DNA repair protein Ada/methylated-DNA--[protein]-cysteine S-methyltransferase [Sinorhizobium sp. BG8]QRM54052.1 bifunctional transcriptional activator/DNA repair protein Ada [Sinorhizobium sp. BG8]
MLFDLPDDDTLYDALVARSDAYEGRAYVCVTTTGIFCRLTCPARKPLKQNTFFCSSIGTCMAAGFRACKRCRPVDGVKGRDETVDTVLAAFEREPEKRWTEEHIVAMGLDPSTVRRAFKRTLGTTFLDYARHRRLGLAARHLAEGGRVIEAQFEAGYESPSGFRTAFARLVGKAPAMSSGNDLLFADWMETPLGPMVMVGDKTHLHLLEFHDRKALPAELKALQAKTKANVVSGRTQPIEQMEEELKAYFAGQSAEFRTPLALAGSEFEKKVWRKLLEIPIGETRSYGDIARELDTIEVVRAVARANGANRIAIVIPCHRCIGSDGSLTGYGGGLWRKQWLLRHEGKMRPVGLFAEG